MSDVVRFKVIGWNVYEGHKPANVIAQLEDLIKKYNPDAIVLQEARFLQGNARLQRLGYVVVQMKNRRKQPKKRPNSRPATANICILVRKNLGRKGRGALHMKRFWRGPVHGFPQDPRVFRWIRVVKKGVVWKLGGFHFPFGAKARKEAIVATRRFIKRTKKGRPVLAVGDYNMRQPALHQKIVKKPKVDAKSAGIRPDHTIFKNCRLVKMDNLGMRGSDHPAILWVFEKNI